MIEEELFGEVSEAKDVVAFTAAYKEAKRVRGYETYRLLASAITLGTHLDLLLSIVRDRLHLASSPSIKNKLTQLLQFAARGVRENPTATAEPLMVWVHGALKEGLEADERQRQRAEGAAGAAVGQKDAALEKKKMKPKGEMIIGTQSYDPTLTSV
jgi:U3 small nucleolar RNA-associated protein 20